MSIAQETRDLILALSEDPAGPYSIREIARRSGVSAPTVTRILKESLQEEAVTKNVTEQAVPVKKPARPRTNKKQSVTKNVTQNVTQNVTPAEVQVIDPVEITREQTLNDTYNLLQEAKRNLILAKNKDDGSPQATNAINGATRAVMEILRELGKWCGLQESIKSSSVETKPASELTFEECIELMEKP